MKVIEYLKEKIASGLDIGGALAVDGLAEVTDQKEFALSVKDYKYSALLFTIRKKGVTINQAWADAKESYKVDLLQWQKDQM